MGIRSNTLRIATATCICMPAGGCTQMQDFFGFRTVDPAPVTAPEPVAVSAVASAKPVQPAQPLPFIPVSRIQTKSETKIEGNDRSSVSTAGGGDDDGFGGNVGW